jgi:hypothetical protein
VVCPRTGWDVVEVRLGGGDDTARAFTTHEVPNYDSVDAVSVYGGTGNDRITGYGSEGKFFWGGTGERRILS